jgi:DNA polymerase III alpha subunit (gram-positive type)
VLVAHNAGFDTGFMGYRMKEDGIAPIPNMVLDTKELVKNLFPDVLDRSSCRACWRASPSSKASASAR